MINEQYGTENITDIQRIRLGYARKEKVRVMFCLTVDEQLREDVILLTVCMGNGTHFHTIFLRNVQCFICCCVNNEKENLRENFKPCLLHPLHTADQSFGQKDVGRVGSLTAFDE